MSIIRNILLASSLVFIVAFTSCYNDKSDVLYPKPNKCDTTNVSFAADVLPVLLNNCGSSGCHDAATKTYGYDFSSYEGASAAAGYTRLLGTINHTDGYSAMPKGLPKLDDCSINKITRWVNTGAKNN
jgi:hypothetical protein